MTTASYDGNGLRAATTITPSGGIAATQNYLWDTVSGTPSLLMDSNNAYISADGGPPLSK
jgi:hypothetical protein